MNTYVKITLLATICQMLCYLPLSYGDTSITTAAPSGHDPISYKDPVAYDHEQQYHCPPSSALVKKNMLWVAPYGWVSYDQSFIKDNPQFFGAEWVGIKVGKIICLYKDSKTIAFPVALQQKQAISVPMPSGGNWRQEKESYFSCFSSNVYDCLFKIKMPEPNKNIYDDIDFFKDKTNAN